jgi:prevent-host-death family protein
MARRSSEQSISAADANRYFSELLGNVRKGRSYVVTSHGKPVARILPFDREEHTRDSARRALLAHLKAQPVVNIGKWTRESLYEADE